MVSVSLTNQAMTVPAASQLYLRKVRNDDSACRAEVGASNGIVFLEKWWIALDQMGSLFADDIQIVHVDADVGCGDVIKFRDEFTNRGYSCVVGIKPDTTVWPAEVISLRQKHLFCGKLRLLGVFGREGDHRPIGVCSPRNLLPPNAWENVRLQEGTEWAITSRFAMVRVPPTPGNPRSECRPEEWSLWSGQRMLWPQRSTPCRRFPRISTVSKLVPLGRIRWRNERDWQKVKNELGVKHYECRRWRSVHQQGTLCLAAERGRLSSINTVALPKVSSRGAPALTHRTLRARKAREA